MQPPALTLMSPPQSERALDEQVSLASGISTLDPAMRSLLASTWQLLQQVRPSRVHPTHNHI